MNKNQKTNRLQLSWLNAILHLTAIIATKKRFLLSSNILNTIEGVFTIVVLEGVLAIISFPLYFAKTSENYSQENDFTVQFQTRKILTLGLLLSIVISFVAKFAIVLYLVSSGGGSTGEWCTALFPVLDSIITYGSAVLIGIGFLMLFLTT